MGVDNAFLKYHRLLNQIPGAIYGLSLLRVGQWVPIDPPKYYRLLTLFLFSLQNLMIDPTAEDDTTFFELQDIEKSSMYQRRSFILTGQLSVLEGSTHDTKEKSSQQHYLGVIPVTYNSNWPGKAGLFMQQWQNVLQECLTTF